MNSEEFLLQLLGVLVQDRVGLQQRIDDLEKRLRGEIDYLRGEIKGERNLRSLTGESQAMKKVRQAIHQVAPTDSTVLIQGETGTGKELVARGIHQLSPRRDHLLVSVNCAALSPSILPSELFGHEAGAFTGATKARVGRFELAHGGTLFLDEIAEVSLETQVMLLRVLQERTMERVGGNHSIPVNVRIIAATHQDLHKRVQEGRFRQDLYFRLHVFPIHVPPLRERPEDISSLASHFLHHFNRKLNRHVEEIDAASLERMLRYSWPGNVRELENILERAMISATGRILSVEPQWLLEPTSASSSGDFQAGERRLIEDALQRCQGKIYGPRGAAKALGLKPTTLYGKMRKLGIERKTLDP